MSATFSTENSHPYSVQFSPFRSNELACCANENYGISGRGCIYVFNSNGSLIRKLNSPVGIFDFSWSEFLESLVFAATADGRVVFYDLNQQKPLLEKKVHDKEIYHVDCSAKGPPSILTSSWDGTLSIFDAQRPDAPINRFRGHAGLVYCGVFSPSRPNFASTSRDGTVRIWDSRSTSTPLITKARRVEILTCDWCKYDDSIVATGATDGQCEIWDLRRFTTPVLTVGAHRYAIRCLKWSPFSRNELATCSYDRTTRVWNLDSRNSSVISYHSEFVYGLDYNLHAEGQIADCSWDRTANVYRFGHLKNVL